MPSLPDPVELTQQLVRMDTTNPPGNEEPAARWAGEMLAAAGLAVTYHPFAPGRCGLIAELPGQGGAPPLVMTGHLDTVPLGHAAWSFDPLDGGIEGGRLRGRGSSDMKGGVAAMLHALLRLAGEAPGPGGVALILTAAEETGCQGAIQMAEHGVLPARAGAVLVAEPTANRPLLGHKGALWLECIARGRAAHGSMPHMGDNAIYKAARAVTSLEDFWAGTPAHPLMGAPSLNVGTIQGGTRINMVPDLAGFQVDMRTLPGMDHNELEARVSARLGDGLEVKRLKDQPGFLTPADHPWVARVREVAAGVTGRAEEPGAADYFTDGAVLAEAMGWPPTLILGPGGPDQAHHTDEYCRVELIQQAAEIYFQLAAEWRSGG